MSPIEVAEYEQLKSEQRTRITIRDNLIYATFIALGSAMAFSLSAGNTAGFTTLLAVPLVCFALGWTYLRNNHKIASIGRYIAQTFPCEWETHRLLIKGRRRMKILQLLVDLTVFVFTGLFALGLYWGSSAIGAFPLVVSFTEVALLTLLASELVRHSDVLFKTPREGSLIGSGSSLTKRGSISDNQG